MKILTPVLKIRQKSGFVLRKRLQRGSSGEGMYNPII